MFTSFYDVSQGIHAIQYIAMLIIVLCFIPQAIMVVITRETKSTSLLTWLFYEFSNLLWIVWAIIDMIINTGNVVTDITVLVPNLIVFAITMAIVVVKAYNCIVNGEDKKLRTVKDTVTDVIKTKELI